MKKETKPRKIYVGRAKPWIYAAVLLVNALAFVFIGWVYSASARSYTEKLFAENIHSVENLNAASANAAYTYACGMGVKIDDAVSYIKARGLSYEDALSYLGESNTDPDRRFQLVLSGVYGETGVLSFGDYSGVSIRKVKADGAERTVVTPIKYAGGYYDIFKSFTDVGDESFHGVCFAPEFTDPDTKLKCFAVYRHVDLTDVNGRGALYTVLLAVNSSAALDAYDAGSEYEGQSTVLVNSDGDYIVKNSDFRNVNFYDYIVNYNGLTLDWRVKIQNDVLAAADKPVNLFYQNHRGDDCVFSVMAMDNGWHSITCVPLSSFGAQSGGVDYSLVILLIFLALFILDGLAIFIVGKTLKESVAEAERASEAANSANKAKSRFLSTMSHELRTPLNAIIGLVTLSKDSIGNPSVLKDYLRKIDISSKLLLRLISDILDVSAIESDKMKLTNSAFDMTKLITSLSAIYYDQCAAKGIEFHVALKDMRRETLVGDSVRVNQVLLNFLSNAVKFTPSGGRVTLTAQQLQRDDKSALIRFEVSDTGCGIPQEMRLRLFKPFERASGDAARKYGGSGLGLSIAKNLTELMNGRVGVESREGVGTSFWAEIPFGIPADNGKRSFRPIKDLRVLAAIGDEGEREYIGQILSGFGAEHRLTDSAESAIELLKEQKADKQFNLCILDWKTHDLSGLDATREIREQFDKRALRIMVLAYNIAEADGQCAEAGADTVLGKPVFPSALYNMLEEIAGGAAISAPKPSGNYDLTGKRVLLVEDNFLNTEIARLLLEKVGARVETAENGKLGFDSFAASKPGYFDAILMDIQMPVMDGYKAAQAIRACAHPQAKTIPILAMTADAFTQDVEMAARAGMNAHISKPVVSEDLYRILKENIVRQEKE